MHYLYEWITILWKSKWFSQGLSHVPGGEKTYLVEKDDKTNGKLHAFKQLTSIREKTYLVERHYNTNLNGHSFSWMPTFSRSCFAFRGGKTEASLG